MKRVIWYQDWLFEQVLACARSPEEEPELEEPIQELEEGMQSIPSSKQSLSNQEVAEYRTPPHSELRTTPVVCGA